MKAGSIVVVSLQLPRERFFGRLVSIMEAGVTVRGVDVNAFDDWIEHITRAEECGVQPATVFFPLHRVEKMILDESIGVMPSLSETFLARIGKSVGDHLEP